MSSLYPQSHSPPPYFHKQLSGTSVALICVFFFCFIGIVYLGAKVPRPNTRALASSTVGRLTAWQRRPRLLEIWLDKHLNGTVLNWRVSHSLHLSTVESPMSHCPVHTHVHIQPFSQPFCPTQPLAAWHDDRPMSAHPRQEMTANPQTALVQAWISRASTFIAERRGAIQFPASSPPALPPLSDPRMLNVAVIVAMPRREDTRPVPGSTLVPWDRPGLFYDDGQLELGVTSLLCEQAMSTAPEEYEQTT